MIVVSITLALVANTSYTVYLTTSLSAILLKSIGKVLIWFTPKLSYVVYKVAKSVFDTSVDISMPVAACCQAQFCYTIR